MEVVDGVSPVESINAAEDLLYVVEHVDPAVKAELQNVKSFTRSKSSKPKFTPRKVRKLRQI